MAVLAALVAMGSRAQNDNSTWSGKLSVYGTEITLVFHLDGENCTMDSPDQGVKGVAAKMERTTMGIKVTVPSINATYEGVNMGKSMMGTFKQHGQSFPLTLTPGEPKRNRPQTPVGPYPYQMQEVSFSNGDAVLKGTLVTPKDFSRKTPVLLMVTGSGVQNRDEEIFEHKPFAVIADALARQGIATLRYDDRGFGESTGDLVNVTTEDLKNDALAGIELLRKQFDCVGVIGHSEGGNHRTDAGGRRQGRLCGQPGRKYCLWSEDTLGTEPMDATASRLCARGGGTLLQGAGRSFQRCESRNNARSG